VRRAPILAVTALALVTAGVPASGAASTPIKRGQAIEFAHAVNPQTSDLSRVGSLRSGDARRPL
jgi:hypothetical protein